MVLLDWLFKFRCSYFIKRVASVVVFILMNPLLAYCQRELIYLPFGGNVADSSRYAHPVVEHGSPDVTTDRFGNPCGARCFDGTSDFYSIPHDGLFDAIRRGFSVVCWLKIPQSNLRWATVVCKGDNPIETPSNPHFRFQAMQAAPQSTISINTDFTEFDGAFMNHTYPIDTWFMYSIVYDGRNVMVYQNRDLTWMYPYTGLMIPNISDVFVGRDIPGSDEFFLGCMDDFRLFGSALTQSDISKLYGASAPKAVATGALLNCEPSRQYSADIGTCAAKLNISKPTITAECGQGFVLQIKGPASGSAFPVGVSQLVYRAKIMGGNTEDCMTEIEVLDKEAPTITCVTDTTIIFNGAPTDSIMVNVTEPTATDNCLIDRIEYVNGWAQNVYLRPGVYSYETIAFDRSGNIARCTTKVEIRNRVTTPTVVSIIPPPPPQPCPVDIITINDKGFCSAKVQHGYTGTLESGVVSGRAHPVGVNPIAYANPFGPCVFKVIVEDTEAPIINCPSDTTILAEDSSGAYFEISEGRATDNCKVAKTTLSADLTIDGKYRVGSTQVEMIVVDSSGNMASCDFKVNVVLSKLDENKPANIPSEPVKLEKPLAVNLEKLTLVIYDNSQEDNDTVSIFFNGMEIVQRACIRRIEKAPIIKTIELVPGKDNTIYVKAWNTGLYSPNTLQVDIHDAEGKFTPKSLRRKKPLWSRSMNSKPGLSAGLPLIFEKAK